ncbi:hypothetical protein PV_019 (endogenous virus) [Gutovirus Vc1]|uniref:Rhamnogalacturonase A/B/Epimerase-like pectate lyase domain-containing protein n=1 Tax=Vibrio phage Vc1 TaxID=1480731 RepID=X2KUH8_9CAUD|nr:hypothetical protein HOQ97_gp19 [Vibrio phage Vc1]AHN84670.1 hypothetical protein PV_019 [Vibrio phage Vc1]
MALTNLTKPRARWATFQLKKAKSIARSLYDRLTEGGISVRDFGATGDGTTDDTTALQAALDATPENGTLRIPRGSYKISANLTRDLPIRLIGGGYLGTRIIWDEGLWLFGLDFNTGGVFVRGLTVGTNYIRPDGKPDGASLGYGVRVQEGDYSDFTFVDCKFSGLNDGILFVNGASGIQFVKCRFANMHHRYTSNTTGGYGIIFQACQDTLISKCRFDKTINRRGVYLSTTATPLQESRHHQITKCKFFGRTGGSADYPTGYEIHLKIRASSDVVVSGNTFDGGLGGIFGEQSDDHTMGNYPENVTIIGNTFRNFNAHNSDASVITCMNRDAKMRNWTIANNVVKNCACRFMMFSDTDGMTLTGNVVEIVAGENTTYHTFEAISGWGIKNVVMTGNVFINKSTSANFMKLWMNNASAEAIKDMTLQGNVIAVTAYSAMDIRGYSGSVTGIISIGNTVRGYGGGSVWQISTDTTVELVYSGGIGESYSNNDRVVQVVSAVSGTIRLGSTGGTVTVPSSAISVYSDMKRNGTREFVSDTVPTSGDYIVGDIIYRNTPVAGGYVGWICVTAGNPGTWKSYGAIEA